MELKSQMQTHVMFLHSFNDIKKNNTLCINDH
jgi:hypothetical protein